MAKRKSGALLTRIVIDRDSRVPLFRQFEDQLRGAILAGSLSGATRLPAIRALAVDLGVSRTTVVQVLESLAAKGFLDLRRGSGTFVAPTFLLHGPQRVEPVAESGQAFAAAPRVPGLGSRFGAAEVDFIPLENRPFLPNAPAYDQFPFALWPKNVNRQTRQAGATTWATAIRRAMRPCARSSPIVWHCIAAIPVIPTRFSSRPGGHAAFVVAALLLTDPGGGNLFENPGPLIARNLFESLGRRLVHVPVDEDGMDFEPALALTRVQARADQARARGKPTPELAAPVCRCAASRQRRVRRRRLRSTAARGADRAPCRRRVRPA